MKSPATWALILLLYCLLHHRSLVCSFSSSPSKHAPSTKQSSLVDSIQVFDNVFSKEACEELHLLAVDHAERFESNIFHLDNTENSLLTPLEQALRSCLQQLLNNNKNKSTIVEYWCRDEYMNMDAHADIDERELLMNEGGDTTIRCPDFGHVLYLDVDPTIRGPTCVFSKYGGWNNGDTDDDDMVSLVTVPAVAGRVLRFPGDAMHAVPKPSTLWLLDQKEQGQVLEEQDCDEFDDTEDEERRSVILFNVWCDKGPLGVLEKFSYECNTGWH